MSRPYDPFQRGPLPVGVRTLALRDRQRAQRELPTELWYPTTDALTGADLDDRHRDRYVLMPGLARAGQHAVRNAPPRSGRFPLVVFSHGYGGHRRQSTFLCTHLASHGYVVAAPDHTGNTATELVMDAMHSFAGMTPPARPIQLSMRDRPLDVAFAIEAIAERIAAADAERVAVAGHSFGGWTALASAGRDPRIRAVLPLAPAGGNAESRPPDPLSRALDLEWPHRPPTLFIVAARDAVLPLHTMHALCGRLRAPNELAALAEADHMHFCDDAERVHELMRVLPPAPGIPHGHSPPFSALCPAEHAHDTVRALGLAHFDAHLADNAHARAFLRSWRERLGARGVALREA